MLKQKLRFFLPTSRWLILLIIAGVAGCAAHSSLEPVGAGKRVYRVGVGGPIVAAFDTHIPVPYAVAGVETGVSDRWNAGGDIHMMPLAYLMGGGELGASYYPMLNRGSRPTVGIGGRLLILGSFRSGVTERLRVYPILTVSAAWRSGRGQHYIGNDLIMPPSRSDYDPGARRVLISPFAGYKWNLGAGYSLGTEIKWQASNVPSSRTAVEYIGIGKRGALATLFSLEKKQ
jgi:hypothetical protein